MDYLRKVVGKLLFMLLLLMYIEGQDSLQLTSFVRTDYLQKFNGYGSVVIVHFHVPEDTEFVSFEFKAEQTKFSIFNCHHDEVVIYLKQGSIPLVNPNDAKLPKMLFNISQTPLHHVHFWSDKASHYINLTNPRPGYYYATAFHPFEDPKTEGITQSGLTAECSTYIDAYMYVRKYFILDMERNNAIALTIPTHFKYNQTYKFHIPLGHDRLVVTLSEIIFCKTCTYLYAHFFDDSGSTDDAITLHRVGYTNDSIYHRVNVKGSNYYYLLFYFKTSDQSEKDYAHLTFDVKSFNSMDVQQVKIKYFREASTRNINMSAVYHSATYESLRYDYLSSYTAYKQYLLVKNEKSDSFSYNLDLHPYAVGLVPLSTNVTSIDFTVLKFILSQAMDTGGTLEFTIGFVPRITKENGKIKIEDEPHDHVVVICIRNRFMELPIWPGNCTFAEQSRLAPLILNSTLTNTTLKVPFPDSGLWYVTIKLFCGICTPCKCPEKCQDKYEHCVERCEIDCERGDCKDCTANCHAKIMTVQPCQSDCDCDGPCRRTGKICNTSLIIDIGSQPCISGSCGKNGRCVFAISQGILYSTCLCTNHYKGLDCGDNSDATPYAMIVLELCLLVLSNIIFIPAAYFAFKRKYYIETIVYSSTFLSSSFYHMCDAGENVISFCIVSLAVLQFSDFFCGLLSIWVTLIAMAYLPHPWYSISHITGSIVLAFGTTFNKESLGVFAMPAVVGIVLIVARWFYLRRKTGKPFPRARYLRRNLPLGILVAVTGLLLFGLFETHNNYKYVHSVWHLLMGLGVIILLPDLNEFVPPDEDASRGDLLS